MNKAGIKICFILHLPKIFGIILLTKRKEIDINGNYKNRIHKKD